jgi:hypothetical protein
MHGKMKPLRHSQEHCQENLCPFPLLRFPALIFTCLKKWNNIRDIMCAAFFSKNTAEASDSLRCKRCGKDLMLSIVPKGPGRIFRLSPITALRCLRCGKRTWTLAPIFQRISPMGVVIILGLGLFAFSILRLDIGGRPNSTVSEKTPQPAQKATAPKTAADPAEPQSPPVPKEEALQAALPAQEKTEALEEVEALEDTVRLEDSEGFEDIEAVSALPPKVKEKTPPPAKVHSPAPKAPPRPTQNEKVEQGRALVPSVFLLEKVTAQEAGDALVILIRTPSRVKDYSAFTLASPPRLVFDAPGTWRYEGSKEISVGKKGVTRLRIGVHGDKLRIVIDMTKTPPEPVLSADPEGLSIILQ